MNRQCPRGFTLIEMTVVLLIIAIGLTLAVPLIEGGFDSREVRRAARQEQFLEVVSAAEARRRFEARIDRSPLPGEALPLAAALSRVIAADVIAPVDAPPFDRANVDGFAVRADDTAGASERQPKRLVLNTEILTPGTVPAIAVQQGTATLIATGGMVPRGADAVVMV